MKPAVPLRQSWNEARAPRSSDLDGTTDTKFKETERAERERKRERKRERERVGESWGKERERQRGRKWEACAKSESFIWRGERGFDCFSAEFCDKLMLFCTLKNSLEVADSSLTGGAP